jgi:hypothetical protein
MSKFTPEMWFDLDFSDPRYNCINCPFSVYGNNKCAEVYEILKQNETPYCEDIVAYLHNQMTSEKLREIFPGDC